MAYTTIDDPSAYFHTQLYAGDGSSSNAITNDANAGDFKPDWIWIKNRTTAVNHVLHDSSRGASKRLYSNASDAESTTSNFSSFDTDGFTFGGGGQSYNDSSKNYVAWQWKAGGTAPTKTYKVVVVDDSGNKYRFRNSGDTATFAQSAVTLDLQEGGTYVFDWSDSTAQGHPIRFSTTSDGTHGGGSEYTTGVVKDDSAYKTTITVAASAPTLYYYCSNHSGMGGQVNTNTTHGQTNFDGSILSVSQANTTAGFSIVTWTGTGSNATIGHRLGVVPQMIISKSRGHAENWAVYHHKSNTAPEDYYLALDDTRANTDSSVVWNDTAPTSSVISIGTQDKINKSSSTHIAYCFNEIQGYSKFGSYTGNGNADGPFVYTGFKPALVIAKRIGSGNDWRIADNKRDPFNIVDGRIKPNESDAEDNSDQFDFLSNGFKLRTTAGDLNGTSGHTFIYIAFAEHPFVSSKGVPVTAR